MIYIFIYLFKIMYKIQNTHLISCLVKLIGPKREKYVRRVSRNCSPRIIDRTLKDLSTICNNLLN